MKAFQIEDKSKWIEALKFLDINCPRSEWPPVMRRTLFRGTTICMKERMRIVTFLFCNGVVESIIHVLLQPVLKDESAKRHVKSLLKDLKSNNFDSKWFYYNVNLHDFLYLNGKLCDFSDLQACGIRIKDAMIWNRKLNSLSKYMYNNKITLTQEQNFLLNMDETNPVNFFLNSN